MSDAILNLPAHLQLARKNTPLQKLERLSEKIGVDIFFKRDDLTGSEVSGNKIRKLEFLLADAKKNGAETVITCGGAQSNHCRATALAAAKCGLSSILLLRTEDPKNPPKIEGNILLDMMTGAEIVWVTPEEYKDRASRFELEVERLRIAGQKAYIIPEGGSNHIGSWGYVLAMQEIISDLEEAGLNADGETTVLSAIGSGGTSAGLVLGQKLLKSNLNVVGVNVCDDRDYFTKEIIRICENFSRQYYPDLKIRERDINIVDGYVGLGYALSKKEELQAIYELSRLEGIVLDPVYTGKAFYGMLQELAKNKDVFGKRVVFVHTGGLFGLFPIADQLAELF
ncbi:MAG: D-cysteine desulfhydrase family protein [Desulfotalea sp.]